MRALENIIKDNIAFGDKILREQHKREIENHPKTEPDFEKWRVELLARNARSAKNPDRHGPTRDIPLEG